MGRVSGHAVGERRGGGGGGGSGVAGRGAGSIATGGRAECMM